MTTTTPNCLLSEAPKRTQNIGTVWGQLRVSTINLDITEDEFQRITHAMAQATEHLLGPKSEIRKRYDALQQEGQE